MQIALKNRFFGLDFLRALAIVLVVGSHAFHLIEKYIPKKICSINLPDGVELFFVLSGFLVGSILLKLFTANDFAAKKMGLFFFSRWMRTLPLYYLVILFLCVYWHVFPLSYFLFLQNFKHPELDPYWFYPEGWSLSVEEWFYIITPLLLFLQFLFLKKKEIFSVKYLFITTAFLLIGFSFSMRYLELEPHANTIFWNNHFRKIVLFRLDALMFGLLAAWANFYAPALLLKYKNTLFFIGLLLILWQTILYQNVLAHSFWMQTFYFDFMGIGIALLFPFLLSVPANESQLGKAITWLSLISYPLYLIHRSLVLKAVAKFIHPEGLLQSSIVYVFYWLFVLAFAYWVHTRIEVFILRKRTDWLQKLGGG